MINTLTRAAKLAPLLAAAAIFATAARVCASAEPGAARRHQIPMPLGLHRALLQRAAGRRGIAAMPAEEHVEPLIELPERGARRRSAGGCATTPSRPKPRRPKAAAPAAATTAAPEIRRAKGRSRRRADSRPAHRFPPSAAPAAPTIRRSARACRPAARRRCNAWKRTRQNSRPVAETPSPPPAAVVRQRRPAAGAAPAAAGAAARCSGGADRDRAAADAAARRTVRAAVGLRRRRPLDLRRRGARRRPDRAVPRDQRRTAFAGMQGRAVAVRRAIDRTRLRRSSIDPGIAGHSPPRKARMS